MSYRSKRTFLEAKGDAPKDKEPVSASNSRLATSEPPPKKPFDPSTNKWGPFNPPTLATDTFGYIAKPINPTMAAKNVTKFTLTPTNKAAQSTTPEIPTQQQSSKTIPSKVTSNPSQPSLTTPQHSTLLVSKETMQQKKKVTHGRLEASQHQGNFEGSQVQVNNSMPNQRNCGVLQGQQRTTSFPSQPLQKRATQPATSPSIGTKPPTGKGIGAATKHVISRTPPTRLETFTPTETMAKGKSQSNMLVNEDTQSLGRSTPPNHDPRENFSHESQSESDSDDLNEGGHIDKVAKNPKSYRPRHRTVVPNWPDNVPFDDMEEAVAFDSEGKRHLVKGSVQARDVWNDKDLRYYVQFNDLKQPIRKGGSILVSFLGDIAKRELFCPVGELSWHNLGAKMKAHIVIAVRKHFIIPEEELFDKAIEKRTAKYWKQYRYFLRASYFNPKQTKDEIYEKQPNGISPSNWTKLVDYWFSPKFENLSKLGKDARSSQAHAHFSGATSFANRRVNLEKEKGNFSELDFYRSVYTKKDGSFREGTLSRQFLEDASAKVEENLASSSSSTLSRVDIENQVFNDLMYKGEVPKRPLNYGFGVKQSDIFGVQSILRKRDGSSCMNHGTVEVENLKVQISALKKQNEDLQQKNEALETKFDEATLSYKETTQTFKETNQTFKLVASHLAQVLNEVRKGNVSAELLDGAQAAIQLVDFPQISDDPTTNGKK